MSNDPDHSHRVERRSPSGVLPVAPSMGPAVANLGGAYGGSTLDFRVAGIACIASVIGIAAALIAELLTHSISFITNLAFYGKFAFEHISPAGNALGMWVILIPVIGALIVGVMARYGSAAIRGHGIPEAMEQVLFNKSRIPARVVLLKPLSSVISIGTGGPFGAEGPIIATGGALGSLVGQYVRISADERKTLLAAGAAAGMAATFGSPVAAVLLAVELLLFEYRPRSLIPVILASVAAAGVRLVFHGVAPAFSVIDLPAPTPSALAGYITIGAVAGVASVIITKAVYAVEDGFERLPIHWMWWPALGALPVGIIGVFAPRTMGVGYDNIEQMISGGFSGGALAILCWWKFVSWLSSLGSGTSGGTLAPLFTIGGGIGMGTASLLAMAVPAAGVDLRIGALVGMAALFAGASRAPLTSVVFAFEATRQPLGLLPLLGGCGTAYLLSCAMMKTSIMTEKIARRGRPVPSEYSADPLEQVLTGEVGLREVVTLNAMESVGAVQSWLRSDAIETHHHGFPVIDSQGHVLGVITQRELFAAQSPEEPVSSLVHRSLVSIRPSASLREAADMMLRERIGRLPVMEDARLVGIVTRSDLLEGHTERLVATNSRVRARRIGFPGRAESPKPGTDEP